MSHLQITLAVGVLFFGISVVLAVLLGVHDLIAWLNNRRRA